MDINYFGYLDFEYVVASDTGTYHCVASNSIETVWKEFNIHVNVLEVSTSDETSPASTPSLTENTESTTHFSSSETSPISLSTPADQTETPNPTQRTSFIPTFLTTTTVPSTASTTPIPHTIYTPCGLAREMTYLLEDADMWDENIEICTLNVVLKDKLPIWFGFCRGLPCGKDDIVLQYVIFFWTRRGWIRYLRFI